MTHPVSRAIRCAAALSLLFGLVGCGSTPETYQPPAPPPTPLQACLNEAFENHRQCAIRANLNALATARSAAPQMNVCDDRKMAQEDRCYARHK